MHIDSVCPMSHNRKTIKNTDTQWHVLLQNGAVGGPFTLDHIHAMINAGQIHADTWIWKPGSPRWAPACTYSELAAHFPPSPSKTPPSVSSASAISPRPAQIGLSRVCLACGYRGVMQKKSPPWVIVCAIAFFPFGLFLLFIKKFKCPQCGTCLLYTSPSPRD